MIWLDPSWGTSWRFKELADFWSLAPEVFPNGSNAWRLSEGTTGVVVLQSRAKNILAYSTKVGSCTVQTLIEISAELQSDSGRMIDNFAELLADCSYRCRVLMPDIQIYQQTHVLFLCELARPCSASVGDEIKPLEDFEQVVVSAEQHIDHKGIFRLQIDARAMLAGLNASQDGSFEVRCLLETLERCHAVCGLELPFSFADRFKDIASKPARYHLQVVNRDVDVPDYAVIWQGFSGHFFMLPWHVPAHT